MNEDKKPVQPGGPQEPKRRLTAELEAFSLGDQFADALNGVDHNTRCLVLARVFAKILPVKPLG